jgi:hypothetical protein
VRTTPLADDKNHVLTIGQFDDASQFRRSSPASMMREDLPGAVQGRPQYRPPFPCPTRGDTFQGAARQLSLAHILAHRLVGIR